MILVVLLKKRIITLELLRLIIRYQVLMVKLLKIKKNVSIENEFKKLIKKLAFFILGNIFFGGSGSSQAYLIFQPEHKY